MCKKYGKAHIVNEVQQYELYQLKNYQQTQVIIKILMKIIIKCCGIQSKFLK